MDPEGPSSAGSSAYPLGAQDETSTSSRDPRATPSSSRIPQLERSGSNPARMDAIAKLKRAASNREMQGSNSRGPSPLPPAQSQSYDIPDQAGRSQVLTPQPPGAFIGAGNASTDAADSTHLAPSSNQLLQPFAPPSSARSLSPNGHANLARSASASRAEQNRSPLPSLEQLRSRILHERLTAGLQRSASAGAASAAARAYALNKLLGQDTARPTSPVSDSGGHISEEEDEEAQSEEVVHSDEDDISKRISKRQSRRSGRGSIYLRPTSIRSIQQSKNMLRRSRTMSGMSQRAEEQRKIAFGQEHSLPTAPESPRKKRMSRLPPKRSGTGLSLEGTPEEPVPIVAKQRGPVSAGEPSPSLASDQQPRPQQQLTRQPSQREVARTEMMRKLSGRRPNGRSPALPSQASPALLQQRDEQINADQSRANASLRAASEDGSESEQHEDGEPSDDYGLDYYGLSGDQDAAAQGPEEDDDADDNDDEEDERDVDESGDASFNIPIQRREPLTFDQLPILPTDSNVGGVQLTPEQQVTFLQMQQLLQQQQLQLQSARLAAPSEPGPAPLNPVKVPMTPVAKRNNSIATTTSPNSNWDSPGAQSTLGANLIPSMHLAPFLSESGFERALSSDATRGARGERPVQDWPKSPSESSLGWSEAEPRSRLGSLPGDSLAPDGSAEEANESHETVRARRAPVAQPVLTTPLPGSNHQPSLSGSIVDNANLLRLPFEGNGPISRHSAATSNGEGDHFLYDTYLANAGRSASTLGQFAHSPLPGNYDATSAAMRAAAGSPLSTLMNLRADQSGGKHALDARPAFEQTRQLSASGGSGMPSQTESHSPILPRLDTGSRPGEASLVASGSSSATGASLAPSRVEQDLAVSPTLLKEIKQGIDWPEQTAGGVDRAPASADRQQQAPPGRNNSSSSSQYSEPPPTPPSKKTSLPRSPSGRRKAPPPIGNLEDYASPSQKSSPALGATTKSAHTPPPRSAGLPAERSLADGTRQILGGGGPVVGSSRQAPDRLHTTAPVASSASMPRPASPQGARGTDASIRTAAVQTSGSAAPSAWQGTSVGLDLQTLYRSRHHKVPSASQQDTETAFANGKLTPFPGLIRNPASSGSGHSYDLRAGESNRGTPSANTPIVQSPQMSSSRRQSPVQLQQHKTGSNSNVTFASPTTSASTAGDRSVTIADIVEQEAQKTNAKASPSLFGSLRRKVSAVRKGSVRRKQPDTDVASSPVLVSPPASAASPITQALPSAPQRALSPPQSASSQSGPLTSLSRRPSALQRLGSLGRRGARSPAVSSPVSTPPTTAAALPYEGMQDMSGPSIESHSRFAVQTSGQSPVATRIELNPDPLAGMADQPSSRGSGLPLGAKSLTQSPVHKLAASHHGRNDSLASVVEVARPSSPTVPVQQLPVGEDSLDSGYAEAPISGFATSQLEPKQADMLHRYSRVLTSTTRANTDLPPGLTTRDLQSPPRELLKVSPVFQVVSASTIKDRFLILFNDILIVAKPIAPPEGNRQQDDNLPDIRWTFAVKKVLELRHLTLTVPKEHRTKPKHHPLQEVFVSAFARDPAGALDDIMTRTALAKTPSTIAHFLVQTPDLDKTVLTSYLCDSTRRDILTAYIKLQRVTGVSIESALRSVLMGLRFPSDSVAFEALLISFSSHWIEENKELIKATFTSQLAADLTFAIMALNDALHGHKQLDSDFDESDIESEASHHQPDYEAPGIFTDAMPSLSKTAFVTAFRVHDPAYVLSDRTLLRIYTSVKTDPIQQALGFHELQHRKAIRVHGTGVPLKLVYGVTSEPITISIPEPDAGLAVRLYGRELIFDPPILSFENTTTRTFTITSRALGLRHAVFVRAGKNARFYSGSVSGPEATKSLQAAVAKGIIGDLPKSTVLTIERAFMQHSFTLTSSAAATSQPDLPSTSSQRKFLFSVDDAVAKRQWVKVMQRAIDDSIERRAQLHEEIQSPASSERAKGKRAASALALQVLKQALISNDANSESASAINRTKRGLLNDAGLQRSASAMVAGTSSLPGRATPSGNDADVAGLQAQQRAAGPSPNLYRTPSDSRFAFKGAKGPPPSTFQRRGLEAALERNVSVSRHYYAADSGAGRAERDLLSPPAATPLQQQGRSISGGSAHSNGSAVDVTLSHDIDGNTSADTIAAGPSETQQAPEEDEQTRAKRMLGVARFLRSTAATAGGEAGLEERQVSGEELVTICTQNSLLPLVLERANMR